jgi:hypothetical protein
MWTTQIHGEAYSPRYNTQPFLPIRLHHRKCRLRMEDRRTPMLVAAAITCQRPTSFYRSPRWPPCGGIAHTPCCVATYLLVCHHRPWFFLTLNPSHVPPCSVVIVGIAIVPIEQYGDQIGCQIVPAIGGVGEIIKAWLRPVSFLKHLGIYQVSLFIFNPQERAMGLSWHCDID